MDYPKFIRLKQAINSMPETEKDPNSYVDPRLMAAQKFAREAALRSVMGEENPESVYTEGDESVEPPLLAPDDLIDPTAVGKAGVKIGAAGLPLALGIISNRGAKSTRVGRELALKGGETIKEAANRAIKIDPETFKLSGLGDIDASGKMMQDYFKGLKEQYDKYGTKVIDDPSLLKGKEAKQIQEMLESAKGAAGFYSPSQNLMVMNPKYAGDKATEATIKSHELRHVKDKFENTSPEDFLNYNVFDPKKREEVAAIAKLKKPNIETTDIENQSYKEMARKARQMAREGKVDQATDLMNALKTRHISGVKNLELENTLRPLVSTMDEITPEEAEYLKRFPELYNLIKKK